MFGIGHLFKRIQNVQAQDVLLRSIVKDVIEKHVQVDVEVESIHVKGSTVELKSVSQSLKSAIFIKKAAILRDIAAAQPIRTITDVR